MNLFERLKARFAAGTKPEHLRRGELGERAAKKHLQRAGLKFLVANFRSERGEVDLVFRDGDCLCFIEVKTRSSENWTRPAAAVDARKRRLLSQTALDYLKLLKNPQVKIRFGHRGSFAGRWRCPRNPASAQHVSDEPPLSLRVTEFSCGRG